MASLCSVSSLLLTSSYPSYSNSNFIQRPRYSAVRLSVLNSLQSTKTELPATVQTLWKWLSEEGVVSSKTAIVPGVVNEGLGLIAKKDISRNEVVLEVPKRLWINPDTVSASDIGKVCSGLKPWIAVALFLIREKRSEGSKWRRYIDVLPEETNSPIFWCVLILGLLSVILC